MAASSTIIHLGSPLPTTSSDLPARAAFKHGAEYAAADHLAMNANPGLFGLAPQGVYHAADVAAGAVSSYLTFSPLPQVASNRGGLFSVALSVPVILVKWPGPGRYPAWFPVELGLSSKHPTNTLNTQRSFDPAPSFQRTSFNSLQHGVTGSPNYFTRE